jgi:hypothetical protein
MGSTRVRHRVALDPDGRGNLVAQALIIELSLVELDEQPRLERRVARAGREHGGPAPERGARARGFLGETLSGEPGHAWEQRSPANRDY